MKKISVLAHSTLQWCLDQKRFVTSALIGVLLFVSGLSLTGISPYQAHTTGRQYFRAKVIGVRSTDSMTEGQTQVVRARLLDSPARGSIVSVDRAVNFGDAAYRRLPVGSQVLLSKDTRSGSNYGLVSRWYMPGIMTVCIILTALVVLVGAWRGLTGMLGLSISIFVLAAFVIPRIIAGHNALTTCIIAAVTITAVSIFIAHGVSKRTAVAFTASLLSLLLIVGLTGLASYLVGTSEIIGEDNVNVLYAAHPIDLGGLLTGGIIIASLGPLFDITTGQAAAVDEIRRADRRQTTRELFRSGMSVGREHIAALINTLALVYAGVALPAIISTAVYAQEALYAHTPLIVRLNTETVAEEVVRTAVASLGMLLALPLTTYLAAFVLPRWTEQVDIRIKKWFSDI